MISSIGYPPFTIMVFLLLAGGMLIFDFTLHGKNEKIVFKKDQLHFKVPKLGDLFLGVEQSPIIDQLTYVFRNHTDHVEIPAVKKRNIWIVSEETSRVSCPPAPSNDDHLERHSS